jgi:hypothetical protein
MTAALVPTWRTVAVTVLSWTVLNTYVVDDWPWEPRAIALVTLAPQMFTIVLAVMAVTRLRSPPFEASRGRVLEDAISEPWLARPRPSAPRRAP